MTTLRISSLTALALLSSVGLTSQVAATQIDEGPAYGSRHDRESSISDGIRLYSLQAGLADSASASASPSALSATAASPVKMAAQPAQSAGMPAEPPPMAAAARPDPGAEPGSTPPAPSADGSKPDAADGANSGWSPPGGSVKIEEDQGIRHVSGGVGEGERAELNALSSQFNLRLMFAMQGGDYLSEVQVKALNASGGTILSAKSKGPWFFAQLPPGTYTIEASTPDQPQRQTARIEGNRQTQLNFYWR